MLTLEAGATSNGGDYRLSKQAIGSGATAQGHTLRLVGTLAEPGADVHLAGAYRLTGGFHSPRVAASPDAIFANGFEETP